MAVKQISLANKDSKKIKEIQNEIQLLKLLDHHRIVQYKDDIRKGDHLYIMMEYLESGSLGALTRKFKIDEMGICRYIAQVLEGLSILHGEGIIHRDIKGDNVLLTKDGDVKLADFGVSSKLSRVQTNEICGTPFWMAPEIISLSGATYASDIWSVGCMVIELLSGKPPYFDLDRTTAFFKIVMDPHPPLPQGISALCQDFLMQCFQKEPSLRKSADELMKHPWITQASSCGSGVGGASSSSPSRLTIQTNHAVMNGSGGGHGRGGAIFAAAKKQKNDTWSPTFNSSFSWRTGDKWDSFGNNNNNNNNSGAFETVVKQVVNKKKETPMTNSEKLQEYQEDMDDSSDLFSDSDSDDENETFDLEKRLNYNFKTLSIDNDDEFLLDDDDDVEMNEMRRIEEETAAIVNSVTCLTSDSDALDIISELLRRADDSQLYPILFRTLLNESTIVILSLLRRKSLALVLSVQKLLLSLKKTEAMKEKLLMTGILPILSELVHSWSVPEVHENVVSLIHELTDGDSTSTRMFVSSGSLLIIGKLFETKNFESDTTARKIVFRTIDVLSHILYTGNNQQQKPDLCRMLDPPVIVVYLSEYIKKMVELLCESSTKPKTNAIAPLPQPAATTTQKMKSKSKSSSSIGEDSDDSDWGLSDDDSDDGNDDSCGDCTTVLIRKPAPTEADIIRDYLEKSINILLTFSVYVTMLSVDQRAIKNVAQVLEKLGPQNKLNALHYLKNVSTLTDPNLQELVINSGLLQILVRELSIVLKQKEVSDPDKIPCKSCVHILNALFMLCCYNIQRKETIAKEGAIALLKDIVLADLPMKNIAIDLLLGFSFSTNAETRREFMIHQEGPVALFCILKTMNTRAVWPQMVIEALCELLSNNAPSDQLEYERILAQPFRAMTLIELFTKNNVEQQPWAYSMVPSLCNLLQVSHQLADAFASNTLFIETISQWLSKEVAIDKADPRRLKSLLDVLRICLNEKAIGIRIPRKLVPPKAISAINELTTYTQEKKLALFSLAQELQNRIK